MRVGVDKWTLHGFVAGIGACGCRCMWVYSEGSGFCVDASWGWMGAHWEQCERRHLWT